MSPLDLAVHRTIHGWPGGPAAAAAALKITKKQVLINKVNPMMPQNKFTLDEARDAMLISGDLQILHALAEELGVVVQVPASSPAGLIQELLREQAEHGDVGRVLSEVLADGRITTREAADLRREAQEAIEALQRLVASVQGVVDAGGAVPVIPQPAPGPRGNR